MGRTIVIDLDDTLSDFLETWAFLYNERYKDNKTVDHIKSWNVSKYWNKCTEEELFELLKIPNLYANTMPKRRARLIVNRLRENGDTIKISTAYTDESQIPDKKLWLDTFMGISEEDIEFTKAKKTTTGDIMIDDNPLNLNDFDGIRILFTSPHNKEAVPEDGYHFRCNDWWEVEELLLGKDRVLIDEMIRK